MNEHSTEQQVCSRFINFKCASHDLSNDMMIDVLLVFQGRLCRVISDCHDAGQHGSGGVLHEVSGEDK